MDRRLVRKSTAEGQTGRQNNILGGERTAPHTGEALPLDARKTTGSQEMEERARTTILAEYGNPTPLVAPGEGEQCDQENPCTSTATWRPTGGLGGPEPTAAQAGTSPG